MAAGLLCKTSPRGDIANNELSLVNLDDRSLGLEGLSVVPGIRADIQVPLQVQIDLGPNGTGVDAGEGIGSNHEEQEREQVSPSKRRKSSLASENNNKKLRNVGNIRKRRKTSERYTKNPQFLLGGTITDPLNLNSLADEEISKVLNAETPRSSPLPELNKDPDPVIIPQDLRDPLKLNSDDYDENPNLVKVVGQAPRKRKRRNSLRASKLEDVTEETVAEDVEQGLDMSGDDTQKSVKDSQLELRLTKQPQPVVDKIVSPVLPDTPQRVRKHKRKSEPSPTLTKSLIKELDSETEGSKGSNFRSQRTPEGNKCKRQSSADERPLPKFKAKDKAFQYGNYIGYYGYRNAEKEDERLTYFKKEWFHGKDCLDIGCNSGHVTLYVGKEFSPKKIVGMDIDGKVINLARKHLRQNLEERFRNENRTGRGRFPESMAQIFGPLQDYSRVEGPDLKDASNEHAPSSGPPFPANVLFRCGNFVLKNDSLLETQKEEYDTILCLSVTKWIHLNWGDDGIKRFFKRAYLALRTGGRLILEPQAWPSYASKKKMTETTYRNFYQIKFKPPNFKSYLLQDVGFTTCEVIGTPMNKSKGFRRPILLFTKLSSRSPDPRSHVEAHDRGSHSATEHDRHKHRPSSSSVSSKASEQSRSSSYSKHHHHYKHQNKPREVKESLEKSGHVKILCTATSKQESEGLVTSDPKSSSADNITKSCLASRESSADQVRESSDSKLTGSEQDSCPSSHNDTTRKATAAKETIVKDGDGAGNVSMSEMTEEEKYSSV